MTVAFRIDPRAFGAGFVAIVAVVVIKLVATDAGTAWTLVIGVLSGVAVGGATQMACDPARKWKAEWRKVVTMVSPTLACIAVLVATLPSSHRESVLRDAFRAYVARMPADRFDGELIVAERKGVSGIVCQSENTEPRHKNGVELRPFLCLTIVGNGPPGRKVVGGFRDFNVDTDPLSPHVYSCFGIRDPGC